MNRNIKRAGLGLTTLAAVLFAVSERAAAAAEVVFSDGQNVNVFDSWGTTATSSVDAGNAAYLLNGIYDQSPKWNGGTTNGTHVTFNLGNTQTVSKLRAFTFDGSKRVSNVNLESSTDGITYTPVVGATYSNIGGNEAAITLSSPVTAKSFRLIRNDASATQWEMTYVRAYGPTGALAAGHMNEDLIYKTSNFVNRSGFTGEDLVGEAVNDNPTTMADMRYIGWHGINPAQPSPNWNQTWLQFSPALPNAPVVLGGLGLTFIDGYLPTGTVHFQVHVSNSPNNSEPDSRFTAGGVADFSTSTLALDFTGTLTNGVNYFALYPTIGNYARIDFLSIPNGSTEFATRMGSVRLYQYIPEPGAALLALFGAPLLLRRRAK